MKRINIILLSCIVLFFLSSCGPEEIIEQSAQRQVINETSSDIIIKLWGIDSWLGDKIFQYNIMPKDTLLIDGVIAGGREVYCIIGWSEIQNASISFDNNRIIMFEGTQEIFLQKQLM